jgi:hypothetical protein
MEARITRGRTGWIVAAVVALIVLIPSGVAMAVVGSNAPGSNTHHANATASVATKSQLADYRHYFTGLTDEANPTTGGGIECTPVATVPTGDAFVIEQVEVDIYTVTQGGPTVPMSSTSYFQAYADTPAQTQGLTCDQGDLITSGEAPGGTVGNVTVPIVPGYVIPSGDVFDVLNYGMSAYIYVSGYLVPSSEAPSTPTGDGPIVNGRS